MSPPIRLDLHVHSSRSPDGRSTVEEIAAALRSRRLDGFALTDHNTTAGQAGLVELRRRYPGALFVPGVEISTIEGHLLAYGVSEAPPPGVALPDAIDWVRAHGGEPVLAHPFRWPHGAGRKLAPAVRPVAVETVNGHNGARANRRAARLAGTLGCPATGGSDAHRASELGTACTVFPESCASVDGVLEALRRGELRPEGASLAPAGWLRWGVRTGIARLRRGLRPL